MVLANIPVHDNQPVIQPCLLLLNGLFLPDFTFLQHVYASPLKFYERIIRISIVYLPKNKMGSENSTIIITLVLLSYHEQERSLGCVILWFIVKKKKKNLFVIIQFLTGCSYNASNFLRDESNKGIFCYINEKIWEAVGHLGMKPGCQGNQSPD